MPPSEKFISIIIPNLNNKDRVFRCLKTLLEQPLPRKDYEIIVVDNGSTDGSFELLNNYPEIKVFQEKALKSPYACRNLGIRKSIGNIIVLLDSNCIPSESWLLCGIHSLIDGKKDIVAGPLIYEFSKQRNFFQKFDCLYSSIREEDLSTRTSLPGGNLFCKKEVFKKIGPFHSNVRSLGDIEWTNRAYTAGFLFGFSNCASVYYPAKGFRPFSKKAFRLGRGKKELYFTNNATISISWLLFIAKHFFPPSIKFIKRLRYLNRREKTELSIGMIIILSWYLKILRGFGMIFGKLNKI